MRSNKVLWGVQILLALVFAAAGVIKLVTPLEQMQGPVALPGLLLRFVGAAEVLGAAGLVLPGLFRLHETLVPLAAGGLAIIMAGAVVISAWGGPVALAAIPLVVGVLCVYVVWARRGIV